MTISVQFNKLLNIYNELKEWYTQVIINHSLYEFSFSASETLSDIQALMLPVGKFDGL